MTLSMKQDIPKPFLQNPSLPFFNQLSKIYLLSQNKKSLMKPDTFDFKSLSTFQLQLYSLHNLSISPYMLFEKLRKQSLKKIEMK